MSNNSVNLLPEQRLAMKNDEHSTTTRVRKHLDAIYAPDIAASLERELLRRIHTFQSETPTVPVASLSADERFSQRDVLLITYGDQIQESGRAPLKTLKDTLETLVGDAIGGVHILPFYPYSSDDGFSVIDYTQVDPALGDWSDIRALGARYRLMFDAVINHISSESEWVAAFRRDEAAYRDYFITVDPATDLSQVMRPRTLPLLTEIETAAGPRHVWTTFSADQIDLNFGSPALLLEIIDVLLRYVAEGAELIRLDAIGFMWKEIGTSCIHLPQAHELIRLMRTVLDAVAPQVLLITETNVPHAENISYFGDGRNEAQMVYNFTLPPLTLHAMLTGDATRLSAWAKTLAAPSDETTFFNFMASHDGIGLRPLEGILPGEEIMMMAAHTQAHGGLVSFRANSDGSRTPYELNIVYYDALNSPHADESQDLQVDRFITSQAILLSLAGVPGVYAHSLFGSRNWPAGVAQTGRNRTINRHKFQRSALEAELADPTTVAHQVFTRYKMLLHIRREEPAFHPNGAQRVLSLHPALFSFVRQAPDATRRVLCFHHVAAEGMTISIDLADCGLDPTLALIDLLSGAQLTPVDGTLSITVPACGMRWLAQEASS